MTEQLPAVRRSPITRKRFKRVTDLHRLGFGFVLSFPCGEKKLGYLKRKTKQMTQKDLTPVYNLSRHVRNLYKSIYI